MSEINLDKLNGFLRSAQFESYTVIEEITKRLAVLRKVENLISTSAEEAYERYQKAYNTHDQKAIDVEEDNYDTLMSNLESIRLEIDALNDLLADLQTNKLSPKSLSGFDSKLNSEIIKNNI